MTISVRKRMQKYLGMLASASRLWVGQCTINQCFLFRIMMHVSGVMDVELIGKKNGRRGGGIDILATIEVKYYLVS